MKYLYGIITALNSTNPLLKGINNRNVEFLNHKNLSIAYSDVEDYSLEQDFQKNALIHAEVIENLFNNYPVIPFRFGTVCKNNKGLIHLISNKYYIIANELSRLQGVVEYGIRIKFSGNNAKAKNGKDYLKSIQMYKKKCLYFGNQLTRILSDSIIESKTEDSKEHLNEANYLFLVLREDEDSFINKINKINMDEPFNVTGPWAPYNFCKLELSNV